MSLKLADFTERKLLFPLLNKPQPAAAEQLAFLLRIWKGTTVPT